MQKHVIYMLSYINCVVYFSLKHEQCPYEGCSHNLSANSSYGGIHPQAVAVWLSCFSMTSCQIIISDSLFQAAADKKWLLLIWSIVKESIHRIFWLRKPNEQWIFGIYLTNTLRNLSKMPLEIHFNCKFMGWSAYATWKVLFTTWHSGLYSSCIAFRHNCRHISAGESASGFS